MKAFAFLVSAAMLAGCGGKQEDPGAKATEQPTASSADPVEPQASEPLSDADRVANADTRPAIEVPMTKQERTFVSPPVDFNSDAAAAFYRMVKSDPDVKRVRMPPIPGMEDSSAEERKGFVDDFKTAVFFSKSIRLADGSTLYDLITHCSTGWHDSATAAQVADSNTNHPYVYLQYFMKFKPAEEGFDTEPQALFERYGSRIVAKSGFAGSLLTDPDFMRHSGLRCRGQG
ncbi:hypothetical protein [Aquitalea sp. USM4]|uniref:hypothetical protein n=1 Tax=Aquitalea sp. USM4 TaxID=1590041 RepID=UPI00103BBFC9|nr:hypothetical protein [Aquitalea sp. USM4]